MAFMRCISEDGGRSRGGIKLKHFHGELSQDRAKPKGMNA